MDRDRDDAPKPTPRWQLPENERQVDADAYHIWTPRPMLRSVYWKPDPEPPREAVGGAYEVFLDQRAFVSMHEHVWAASAVRPFGWLIGDLCEDPSASRRFIIVTGAIASRFPFPETGERPAEEAIVALKLEVERRRGVLVGWYHAHSRGDLRLSDADVEEHQRRFPEAWQVAFLFVTDPAAPRGACFRRTPEGFDGATPMPFHEMVTNESLLARGVRRSRLDWGNLSTLDEVRAEPPPRPEPPAVPEPSTEIAEAPAGDAPSREEAVGVETPVAPLSQVPADTEALGVPEPAPPDEAATPESVRAPAFPDAGPVPEIEGRDGTGGRQYEEDGSPVGNALPGEGSEGTGPVLPAEPDPLASSRFDSDAEALGTTHGQPADESGREPGVPESGPEEFDAMVAELLGPSPDVDQPDVSPTDLSGPAPSSPAGEVGHEAPKQLAQDLEARDGAEEVAVGGEVESAREKDREAPVAGQEGPEPESPDGEAMGEAAATPRTPPAASTGVASPRGRSRRGLAVGTIAVIIVALAVFGGLRLLETRGTAERVPVPARPPAAESPAGNARSGRQDPVAAESGEGDARTAVGEDEPGGAAAAAPIDRTRLEAMSDRVLEAISRYYGRDVARERGEISCPELQAAFVEVMDSWIDYSTNGKQSWQGRLPEDLAERDERLYRGVQDVERLYGASGCPRP